MTSEEPPQHPWGERPDYAPPRYPVPHYPVPPQGPSASSLGMAALPAPGSEPGLTDWRHAPRELRPVMGLLALNLLLSVVLTVVTLLLRHSIVDYQLDHRHIADPKVRDTLRNSYAYGIIGRVVGNIVVSVVYVFIVRALIRGRRWAYRRVILVGALGALGLVLVQFSPYPTWMRIEQLVQAVVLVSLVWAVTRPAVRAHFDPSLPGRTMRRFNR